MLFRSDATIIAAPSSTKNRSGERDPEMHQTKKGNQWYFGMKAHIGVDAETGIVHTLVTTSANINDVTQAHALLHGEERLAFGDAGYQGVEKREENRNTAVTWHVALRPGKRRALPDTELGRLDEARQEIKRAIVCKQDLGHAAELWKTWGVLSDIETDAGRLPEAQQARRQVLRQPVQRQGRQPERLQQRGPGQQRQRRQLPP